MPGLPVSLLLSTDSTQKAMPGPELLGLGEVLWPWPVWGATCAHLYHRSPGTYPLVATGILECLSSGSSGPRSRSSQCLGLLGQGET